MYSVLAYGRMAADQIRMAAFVKAIEHTVKPGDVVVDLGAGTGILSILAARAGAKRVHAIDPNPAIWLLPELAAENGVAERIVVHHTTSDEVTLEERANVVVSDLYGVLPLHGPATSVLRDAHQRLVAPGGLVIPASARLFVAVVSADGMWRWLAQAWECFEARGLSAEAARRSVLNTAHHDRPAPIGADDVLSDSPAWHALVYAEYDDTVLDRTVELSIARDGVGHGLAIWFESCLTGDIRLSSSPGSPVIYSRLFLPFTEPLGLATGDRVEVTLRADARGERWAWDTSSRHGRTRQSTFLGQATAPDALLRESSAYRPTTTARGARVGSLLERMDGTHTVEELARSLESSLSAGSPLRGRMLDEVREIVARYAR